MKQFDLISDVHLDFWAKKNGGSKEANNMIVHNFAASLLPDEISEVLVVAGDLGHDNNQNFEFLKYVKQHYKYIIVVCGNHDFYLTTSSDKYKYERNSLKRWKQMKELGMSLEGVHYLNGEMITIDGVTFGGTGMWYDFSYGIKRLGKSVTDMFDAWADGMNDQKYIHGVPRRPLDWFWSEKDNLEKVIYDSDVIVTHVGPDTSRVPLEYELDALTGCYYFDGEEYLKNCQGKIWCYGHSHYNQSYMKKGCWLVNNALGYPNEKNTGTSKIVNIPLESHY
ncbi:Calcineurin-like phosphoesterase [compost metagenome]